MAHLVFYIHIDSLVQEVLHDFEVVVEHSEVERGVPVLLRNYMAVKYENISGISKARRKVDKVGILCYPKSQILFVLP